MMKSRLKENYSECSTAFFAFTTNCIPFESQGFQKIEQFHDYHVRVIYLLVFDNFIKVKIHSIAHVVQIYFKIYLIWNAFF